MVLITTNTYLVLASDALNVWDQKLSVEVLNYFYSVGCVTWAAVYSFFFLFFFFLPQRHKKALIRTSSWVNVAFFFFFQIKSFKLESSSHKDKFDIFILWLPRLNENNPFKPSPCSTVSHAQMHKNSSICYLKRCQKHGCFSAELGPSLWLI